jgi:Arc/MetJ family transcription regulator
MEFIHIEDSMRTNIDIDDDLMAETMKNSGQTTKKAAVEEAMRHYNRSKAFRELVDGMRGIEWDDGLGTVERLERQRMPHAAEDGVSFDGEK